MTQTLTVEQYESHQSLCDGLCAIDRDRSPPPENPSVMPCVTCPFCKELVDAILTPATISCPKCEVTVKR